MAISKVATGYRVRIKSGGRVVADKTLKTRRAAVQWEADQYSALENSSWVDPKRGKESLSSVADRWIQDRAGRFSKKTLDTEKYLIGKIPAELGRLPVAAVSSSVVERLLTDMVNGGLSYGSVKRFRAVLSSMLGWAVRERVLAVNPCLGVKTPHGQAETETREIYPYTIVELRQVFEEQRSYSEVDARLTMILGLTGLRWGELCALRPMDVQSVPVKAFRVQRSASTSQPVRGTTKGHKSRVVPVPDEVWPWVLEACEGKKAQDFLFTNGHGARLHGWGWKLRVHWAETARGRRVHDLRHTFATWALSIGVPPKSVQAYLGHSSATLTLDTYGHYLPASELQTGSELLNASLGADSVPSRRREGRSKRGTAGN